MLEYQKNLVNWALYGQETNNNQRRKYEQDLSKLQYAIKTKVQVTKRSWRSLKVDASMKMEAGVAGVVATSAQVSLPSPTLYMVQFSSI